MKLYLAKLTDRDSDGTLTEEFYKVGVSEAPSRRFLYGEQKVIDSSLPSAEKLKRLFDGQTRISDTPYDVEFIKMVDFAYEGQALHEERELLAIAQSKGGRYWPKKKFSGLTECFRLNVVNPAEFIDLMVQYMDTAESEAKRDDPGELSYKLAGLMVKERDPIKRHFAMLAEARKRAIAAPAHDE